VQSEFVQSESVVWIETRPSHWTNSDRTVVWIPPKSRVENTMGKLITRFVAATVAAGLTWGAVSMAAPAAQADTSWGRIAIPVVSAIP